MNLTFREFLLNIKNNNNLFLKKINFDRIINMNAIYILKKNRDLYNMIKSKNNIVIGLPKTSTSAYLVTDKYMTWHDSIFYPNIKYNTHDETDWDEKCYIALFIIYQIRKKINKYNITITYREPISQYLSNYFYFKYNNGKIKKITNIQMLEDINNISNIDFIKNAFNNIEEYFKLIKLIWGIDIKKYDNIKFVKNTDNPFKKFNETNIEFYNIIKTYYKIKNVDLYKLYNNGICKQLFNKNEIDYFIKKWR